MINTILGQKLNMTVVFGLNGQAIPVTRIKAGPCPVVAKRAKDKEGYWAIQLGFGQRKKVGKSLQGHLKKASVKEYPEFIEEVKDEKSENLPEVGSVVNLVDVFVAGDKLKITGISKGKGFTGVVKRWGFAGGPATHGQSDRERAPGSIGATTTPGRVFKGKKMAGRHGGQKKTVRGLEVIEILPQENILIVKGSVPGSRKGFLTITKIGKVKKVEIHPKIEEKKEEKTKDKKKEETQNPKIEEKEKKESKNGEK